MTSYVSRSLRGDEIYYKWLPWTCLRRLALISREVSQYQYDEVSDTFLIEEDLFRTGMAMEAAWIARVVGWAVTRRIRIDAEVSALYARVRGYAASGTGGTEITGSNSGTEGTHGIPIRDCLFSVDELETCKLRLGISSEDGDTLEDIDKDFYKGFRKPPRWWSLQVMDGLETKMDNVHLNCARALEYASANADFGRSAVDERTGELIEMLVEGQKMLAALGKDQQDTLRRLASSLSVDDCELLKVFVAAYPNARLTIEEGEILAGHTRAAA